MCRMICELNMMSISAWKGIFCSEYAKDLKAAELALTDREGAIEQVATKIETDLTLLGATAIEDKLQDGVPETIANLILGGVKVWVLTGDKQETAINIGNSCQVKRSNFRTD